MTAAFPSRVMRTSSGVATWGFLRRIGSSARLLRVHVPRLEQPPAASHLPEHAGDGPAALAAPAQSRGQRDRANLAATKRVFEPQRAGRDAVDPPVALQRVAHLAVGACSSVYARRRPSRSRA